MSAPHSNHEYAGAATSQLEALSHNECSLSVLQQPGHAKIAMDKEKDRRPIDPPPIVEMKVSPSVHSKEEHVNSPYYFVLASLVNVQPKLNGVTLNYLGGTFVSSLHKLKDDTNRERAFFVFGDLFIRQHAGTYRLRFDLYQAHGDCSIHVDTVHSDPFEAQTHKNFKGLGESTKLTTALSNQGVKLRARKEPKSRLRKDGPADDNYQPRTYRTKNRNQSNAGGQRMISSASQGSANQDEASEGSFNHNQVEPQEAEVEDNATDPFTVMVLPKRRRTDSEDHNSSPFSEGALPSDSAQYSQDYGTYNSQMSQNYSMGGSMISPNPREQYGGNNQYTATRNNNLMGFSSLFNTLQRPSSTDYYNAQTQSYSSFMPTASPYEPQRLSSNSYDGFGTGNQLLQPSTSADPMRLPIPLSIPNTNFSDYSTSNLAYPFRGRGESTQDSNESQIGGFY